MIYQKDGVVFIGNDTSNGYRSSLFSTTSLVPLSYITRDGKVGIMGVNSTNAFDYQDTFTRALVNPGTEGQKELFQFANMINEWSLANVPQVDTSETCPTIPYGDKVLRFPSCAGPPNFAQAIMTDASPMSGGRCKRNCKHSHKKKRTRRKRTTRKL
jgi:hypothetical protein